MLRNGFVHTRATVAVLVLCLLIVSALSCARQPAAPPPPPERQADLAIQPASGKAGAAIKLKGSNFLADEEVEVVLTVGDVYHGLGTEKAPRIVASKSGTFEVDSGVPVRTPPGTYPVKAKGTKGSVASATLEVLK